MNDFPEVFWVVRLTGGANVFVDDTVRADIVDWMNNQSMRLTEGEVGWGDNQEVATHSLPRPLEFSDLYGRIHLASFNSVAWIIEHNPAKEDVADGHRKWLSEKGASRRGDEPIASEA